VVNELTERGGNCLWRKVGSFPLQPFCPPWYHAQVYKGQRKRKWEKFLSGDQKNSDNEDLYGHLPFSINDALGRELEKHIQREVRGGGYGETSLVTLIKRQIGTILWGPFFVKWIPEYVTDS